MYSTCLKQQTPHAHRLHPRNHHRQPDQAALNQRRIEVIAIIVEVSPASIRMDTGQTQFFTATVTNAGPSPAAATRTSSPASIGQTMEKPPPPGK